MPVHDSNQGQAEFWAESGTMWTALRDRFDAQTGAHGLAAIDALAPTAGEYVIDIGCGAGTSTLQLAERVGETGRVRGLDISPTMIEGAAAHAAAHSVANVTFAEGDAMIEPFDGDADAVFSRFGVMFFSDATRGFANLHRALRPGGRIGFVCWQSPFENPWIFRPMEIASRYVELPFGSDPTAPGPLSLADPDRIKTVLADAGFTDVTLEPRVAPTRLGTDLDDAVGFLFDIMSPIAGLRAADPEKAAQLRATLIEELDDWETPDGVESPSAVWIVTGRRPEEMTNAR
jgi:SAM-dependent methyltransferase